MKIGNWTPPTRNDFPDMPEWWERVMKSLNQTLRDVVSCLQGRFTLPENSNVEERELDVLHGVEYEIQLQTIKTGPKGAMLIFCSTPEQGRLTKFEVLSEKSVKIKVEWDTDPGTEVTVRLWFFGGST